MSFWQFLNDALRDQLVCGLIATNIQKRLLSEANLTAERALEISQAMETVEKGAKDFKEEHQDSKRQETETAAINTAWKLAPHSSAPHSYMNKLSIPHAAGAISARLIVTSIICKRKQTQYKTKLL